MSAVSKRNGSSGGVARVGDKKSREGQEGNRGEVLDIPIASQAFPRKGELRVRP